MIKITKKQLKTLIENFLILEENTNDIDFNKIYFQIYPATNASSQIYNFILDNQEDFETILKSGDSKLQKHTRILNKITQYLQENGFNTASTRKMEDTRRYIGFLINKYDANNDYKTNIDNSINSMSDLYKENKSREVEKLSKIGATSDDIAIASLLTKYKEKIKTISGLEAKIQAIYNNTKNETRTAIYIDKYINIYDEISTDPANARKNNAEIAMLVDEKIEENEKKSDYEKTIIKQTYTPPDNAIGTFIYYPAGKDGNSDSLLVFERNGEEISAKDIAQQFKTEILKDKNLNQVIKDIIKEIPVYGKYNKDNRDKNLENIINGLNTIGIKDYENQALKLEKDNEGEIIFNAKTRSAVAKLLKLVCDHKATKDNETLSDGIQEITLKKPRINYKKMATNINPNNPSIYDKVAVNITGIDDFYEAIAFIVAGVINLLNNQSSSDEDIAPQTQGDIDIANEILGSSQQDDLDNLFPPQSDREDE